MTAPSSDSSPTRSPRSIDIETTTQEVKMDRPDLAALAAEVKDIESRISSLTGTLDEAFTASLGEYDEEAEQETVPGNGDVYELYESAKKKAGEARFAISQVTDLLATQQGYRDFAQEGVEV